MASTQVYMPAAMVILRLVEAVAMLSTGLEVM